MVDTLKSGLVNRLKQVGAFNVRIADPRMGYDKALPKRHPLQIWEQCKSVVIFAIAMAPYTNNIYLGPYAPWRVKGSDAPGQGLRGGLRDIGPVPYYIESEEHAVDRLSRLLVSSITMKGMIFLTQHGHKVSFEKPQFKLSAFEAGLGVYGRSGIILNPVLGNRMSLGVIMTDASIEADDRLADFHPCEDCDKCIQACPAKAFDKDKEYPESWSRETCVAKRNEIAAKEMFCHNCFAACPAGAINDEELLSIKTAKSFFKPHSFKLEFDIV